MRVLKLKNDMHRYTDVYVADEPGSGNACHEYYISPVDLPKDQVVGDYGFARFQNGPIGEAGANGCFMEDLLNIVVDRLESFQSGDFACRENALALTKVQEALHWLNHRTADRIDRDVEGKSVK